jgi:hypothetical protein
MSNDAFLNSQTKALISMMARMVKPVKKRWALICPAAPLTMACGAIGIKEFFTSCIFNWDLSRPSYFRFLGFCCAATKCYNHESGCDEKNGPLHRPASFCLVDFQNYSSYSPSLFHRSVTDHLVHHRIGRIDGKFMLAPLNVLQINRPLVCESRPEWLLAYEPRSSKHLPGRPDVIEDHDYKVFLLTKLGTEPLPQSPQVRTAPLHDLLIPTVMSGAGEKA